MVNQVTKKGFAEIKRELEREEQAQSTSSKTGLISYDKPTLGYWAIRGLASQMRY